MRPAEIPDDAVIAAGEALQAEGRRITGFALRARCQGGNPNRLAAVWTDHVARHSAARAEPAPTLPVEVADVLQAVSAELVAKLQRLAADLHQGAVRAAEQRVAEVLRGAAEQREQAQQELADAGQAVEELEGQLADLRAQLEAQQARLAQAHEAVQRREVEHATLKQRLSSAELAAHAAAEAHAVELAQARGEAAQLRDALDQQRAEFTRQVTEQTAQVRAREQQLADEREQHQAERATAGKEALRQAERFTEVQRERDTARQEAQAARESAARLQGEVEALRAHGAELGALLRAFGGDPPAGGPSTAARRRAGP
jgi:colicin import membrane protein